MLPSTRHVWVADGLTGLCRKLGSSSARPRSTGQSPLTGATRASRSNASLSPSSNQLTWLFCGRLVIETLREAFAAEPDRKCFRMVGGVLVERTVKDVLPALESNHEQASTTSLLLDDQLICRPSQARPYPDQKGSVLGLRTATRHTFD